MSLQGDPQCFRPLESLSPVNYSATLNLFLQTLLMSGLGWTLSLMEEEGTPTSIEAPAKINFFIFAVSLS